MLIKARLRNAFNLAIINYGVLVYQQQTVKR